MSNHDSYFQKINEKVKPYFEKLEKELGYSHREPNHGKYASFSRPRPCEHVPHFYLDDVEDCAAYEIRLYSDTYPAINLKEDKKHEPGC
jgi:hypothetical protein